MSATLFLILGLLMGGQAPTGAETRRLFNGVGTPSFGEISGKVVRARTREPMQGISVHLLRKRYDAFGLQRMTSISSVTTNDRGEYRLAILQPDDSFYIAATGPASPLIFYPGAMDTSGAVSIDLPPGQEVRNIDLEMPAAQLFKIHGRVFDALHVRQPHLSSVSLVRRHADLPSRPPYTVAEDGTFEISGVPPGSYYLVGLRIDHEPHRSRTVVQVDVKDEDIQNLELVATEGHQVEGQVRPVEFLITFK